jgi:phosphoketolase
MANGKRQTANCRNTYELSEYKQVKQALRDKLIDHKAYIHKYGQDMPEIRNWRWGQPQAKATARGKA